MSLKVMKDTPVCSFLLSLVTDAIKIPVDEHQSMAKVCQWRVQDLNQDLVDHPWGPHMAELKKEKEELERQSIGHIDSMFVLNGKEAKKHYPDHDVKGRD